MATYRVQNGNEVEALDEAKLRKKLRDNDYSGLELVRRDDEDEWKPLCETQLFRQEVPYRGDPRDAAKRRKVRGFAGHLVGWAVVLAIFGATGNWFPIFMLIWGVFVALHGLKALPTAIELHREGKLFGEPTGRGAREVSDGASEPDVERAASAGEASRPQDALPFAEEVRRVRALLAKQGGKQAVRLAEQVERLASTLRELATKQADLEEQASADELGKLERSRDKANERLRIATSDQDRKLARIELEAVDQRRRAVEDARKTIERLQSRERVAGHQLKQLRLDLSRSEATAVELPDLSSRLEEIRIEAEALDEVEEALAAEAPDRRAVVDRDD